MSKINFIYVSFYRCFMLNDSEIVVVRHFVACSSFVLFFCLRRRRCRRLRRYYCCCCAAFCRTEKFDWIVEMCQPENGNELTLIRINQTYEWYRKSHAKYRIRPRFILNVYTVYVQAYTHYTPCVWSFSTEKVPTAKGNKSIVFTSKRHAKHLCKLTNRGEEKKKR